MKLVRLWFDCRKLSIMTSIIYKSYCKHIIFSRYNNAVSIKCCHLSAKVQGFFAVKAYETNDLSKGNSLIQSTDVNMMTIKLKQFKCIQMRFRFLANDQ